MSSTCAAGPVLGPAAAAATLLSCEEPLLLEATQGNGGFQGLAWVDESLIVDADGDAAHAFFEVQEPPAVKALRKCLRSRL